MRREDILIEIDELTHRLSDPNLRIFDTTIRFLMSPADAELPSAHATYLSGHIPGAAFFDHDTFSVPNAKYMYTLPPITDLARQIGAIGIAPENEVILYADGLLACATRAWWLLRYAGHNRVRILNGGLEAWKLDHPLEQGENHYPATTFIPNPRPAMFASKEEVFAAMNDGRTCTVFAIPDGIYPAGTIVGSIVQPMMQLTRDMSVFLPTEALAERLKDQTAYDRIITYCGGGIAATVNAVAHLMAGNENVAVYDGSLEEWAGEGLPTTGQAST